MKKINKQRLAKIIAEQVLISKRKQNLRESVTRAVRKVLLNEKTVVPEEFRLKLSEVAADARDAKQNVTKGRQDGSETDDVIDVTPNATFPVSQLKPSQSSMNIGKAMGMAISMIAGKMQTGGNLGAFISSEHDRGEGGIY